MPDTSSHSSRDLATELLTAKNPQKVSRLVEVMEENRDTEWVALGREENNYGTVQTQASRPMPCLVELKTNADDAVLIRAFEENAPENADPDDYASMKEAAEEFVHDDPDVSLIADGSIPTQDDILNITVRDDGCGQAPNDFEDTFLGLHTPGLIKQEYSFTQGQYGMGSTGVLQFCGDKEVGCYKFIASASHEQKGEWSWSLIRQNRDANQYEYCLIDGEIPTFDGEFGSELAGEQSATKDFPSKKFGSFVKVYDYRLNATKADIAGQESFLYKLERYIVDSPLDLSLIETRYSSSPVKTNRTRGFLPSLEESNQRDEILKNTETIEHNFETTGSDILGDREISVILFKHDDEIDEEETTSRGKSRFVRKTTGSTGIHLDHAIMFTVNGQTHGDQGISFLKNRCGYSKTADDTVVIMEFDDFADPDLADIFKPTRDRLQDGKEEAQNLLDGLEDALESSDMLRDEEERRRAKRSGEESEFNTESFEEFIGQNPDFADYIRSGQKISGPQYAGTGDEVEQGNEGDTGSEEGDEAGEGDIPRSEAPKLPTYFRLIDDYDPVGDHTLWDENVGPMTVELPVNGSRKVRFATDAQSDYLTRETLGGDLLLSDDSLKKSVEHHDGVITLVIEAPPDVQPGDTEFLTVRLTRPNVDEETLEELDLEIEPEEGESERDAILSALTPEDAEEQAGTTPIYEHAEIKYGEEVEEAEGGPSTPTSSGDTGGEGGGEGDSGDEGSGEEQDAGMETPQVQTVEREQWDFDPDAEDFDPASLDIDEDEIDRDIARNFDENVVMRLEESLDGTISGLTLTINMDSAPLRSFIQQKNVRDNWKDYIENQYMNAVVFFTVSQYKELSDRRGEQLTESEIGVTDVAEDCLNGMGQVMMPILFGPNELDDMTE